MSANRTPHKSMESSGCQGESPVQIFAMGKASVSLFLLKMFPGSQDPVEKAISVSISVLNLSYKLSYILMLKYYAFIYFINAH